MADSSQKTKILIIEDDEVITNLLVRNLEKAGYETKDAEDGIDGLELIKEYKPDLLLLDMMLPRMDGFEILEKLNQEKIAPGLKIIIISNSGQPIEIERAKNLGVNDYVIKVNFDIDEILEKVDHILKKSE